MESLERNPRQKRNRQEIVFFAILMFAGMLRLILLVAVPFGETVHLRLQGLNDEPAHYNYVRHLVDKKSFAVQTSSARGNAAMMPGRPPEWSGSAWLQTT